MNFCTPPSWRTISETPETQIKMVSVVEQDLDAQFFQRVLRHAL